LTDHESSNATPTVTTSSVFRATAAVVLVTTAVVLTGVSLVAGLGARGDAETWTRWSDVGQAFGAVNSIVAALAVAAALVTWLWQSREMRAQRTELAEQGRTLLDTQTVLRRSADVDVRKLHMSLIQIALDRPELAEVWPDVGGTGPERRAQYLYANLLIQHTWLQYTSGISTQEEMLSALRYLFTSPKIRAFWRDTAGNRSGIYVEGDAELDLAAAADRIWAEQERS
jgi:hypothetical protein